MCEDAVDSMVDCSVFAGLTRIFLPNLADTRTIISLASKVCAHQPAGLSADLMRHLVDLLISLSDQTGGLWFSEFDLVKCTTSFPFYSPFLKDNLSAIDKLTPTRMHKDCPYSEFLCIFL